MYTIKQASARSGVSVETIRAWERRYRVVAPERTAAGYRLYDDAAIDRLRSMRELLAAGWRARQAADRVADPSFVGSAAPTEPPTPEPRAAADARLLLVSELVEATLRLDSGRLEAALDEAFRWSSFEAAMDEIVSPALHRIGAAWEAGELDVADEHAVSQAVMRRLARIHDAGGHPEQPATLLVGLPPGARHEIGALSFAIAARRWGTGVVYLGPDLPVASWLTAIRQTGAKAVALGIPTAADAEPARAVLATVGAEHRGGVALLVGGAHADIMAGETGITVLPRPLAEAARLAAARLAV